ncbi:HAD family hydrolase [Raineyella fluvialis]|uniref:HAD-IA family hydrolase n=1 Tax=Raineyella fluvialis TaxID=2662261 RepID=A0A5Q2FEX1_9ACTN|nr:HAD family phosphatase [Raineyella fluvialis]QGF24357.1 HAD-IA family hydrolase [Raineyella fluvialis]
MSPRAVVFDMDGVLTDTEIIWDEVRRGLAADEGIPWPPEATLAMMGMSTQEWSSYLVGTVGLSGTPEEAARRTIDALVARYAHDLPELAGAVDAVRRLAARWPLGLASSSPRRLIDVSLETLGISDAFTVTVSTEEVGRGKPSPDGYLRACELLGVDPATCVAIEDSSNGLRAAAAAGMAVIAVPRPDFPPAGDALALADAVVADLDSLTVDLVEGLR